MSATSSPEAVEPIFQNSPIFNPEIFDVLPNIINHLDPGSFVRFARTCKEMHFTCFNNNNMIKIPCWDKNSAIGHAGVEMAFEATNCVLFTTKPFRQYSADSDFMKNLAKMPFVFNVGLIIWPRVDERILRELRSYFSNFPRFVVGYIQLSVVDDWEGVVEFIKDFRVNALFVPSKYADITYILPSREVLSFITQNLSKLTIAGYTIPDDVILRATTKNLQMPHARISKETFKELIKKFAAGDFKEWRIGREPFLEVEDGIDDDVDSDDDDDIEDEEADEDEQDAFIAAVSEVMKVVEVENIDEEEMEPSTAYVRPSDTNEFFFLRSDGSLCYLMVLSSEVEFAINNF